MIARIVNDRADEQPARLEPHGEMPFDQQTILISKKEHIQLKWEAHYWRVQFERSVAHRDRDIKQLQEELARFKEQAAKIQAYNQADLEKAHARIADLEKRLFGSKSEKSMGGNEQSPTPPAVRRPRGRQRGQAGHGRKQLTHLPAVIETIDLPECDRRCPCCDLPLAPYPDTEDSEVIEIDVKAYRRIIRRKRYEPVCQCAALPAIVTAPVAPKLIPHGKYGVSIWRELILDKFLYGRPTHRQLASWQDLGLPMSAGTVAGGLARLAPLFEPVVQAFHEQQRTDPYWHADETGWKVFEATEGKTNTRWYLWAYRSRSVVYFDLEPTRAASVPEMHFKGLSEGIVICDRYSAYKKMARSLGLLLAFCWAHVRRDFLNLARGYPQLEPWALTWAANIGALYHRNHQRLAAQDNAAVFLEHTAALKEQAQAMALQCEQARQDATLHEAAGKVMASMHAHWDGLTVFIEHPEIPLDNNPVENALRTPVVGRKNYYGSGAIWSAQLAASLFTILLTLDQIWGMNVRLWLSEFLQACAFSRGTPPELSHFLPWKMAPERLHHFGGKPPVMRRADLDTS